MATERQIQANRNNARQSSGPRTEAGKTRVSQNALKHGLLARDAVIPGEDPAEFEAQLAALENALQPEDAVEQELVRQMADAQWRMRRLARLESGYLAACLVKSRHHTENFQPHFLRPGYEGETLLLGHAMLTATQELTHLARCDAHLGRRFERALQQIARLREAREKRQASEAKQANSKPRRSPGAANTTDAPQSGGPQPSASETNNQTKPISPNSHKISEIGQEARERSGRAHSSPGQIPLRPLPATDPKPQHNVPARGTNTPQAPIPDRI